MTYLTRATLLAALMLGTAVASPVAAQKKGEVPAGPKLTVNAKVRAGQAGAVDALTRARTLAAGGITPANQAQVVAALQAADPFIAAAEAAAQTNDELYVATVLRYQKESTLIAARYPGDANGQRSANGIVVPLLDKLLANPVTPPEQARDYAFERGRIQYLNNDYRGALANLQRARAGGSTDPLLNPLLVDTQIKLGDFAGAAAEADKMIASMKAAGQPVPESFYLVGAENAYRAKNPAVATQYELKRLADYPGPKNMHDALTRLMTRSQLQFDTRQRLDVWRLMRASKALADEKERTLYAQDALDVGASREAQAVLEEARAGRPIASLDPAARTLLTSANTRAAAAPSPAKAEADAKAASDAQSALTAGNFNYAAGNYAKAAELYALAQQRGAPDKDALLVSLGAAQAQSGNKAGALASFAAVGASPRKEVAQFWTVWVNQQP